ncbi:hypothetical protein SELMODRAFT_416548 [Selaginella moellendorffii]|uniref:Uncharacterized protein n=1 Tax=Selaginella moellendorffii TaxID=88036 RepID=D8RZM7_SELML|nr:hypothetical protein SELMODRAFT_416548 [Selaginella moellendorffii]
MRECRMRNATGSGGMLGWNCSAVGRLSTQSTAALGSEVPEGPRFESNGDSYARATIESDLESWEMVSQLKYLRTMLALHNYEKAFMGVSHHQVGASTCLSSHESHGTAVFLPRSWQLLFKGRNL